jgi:RNA ligase
MLPFTIEALESAVAAGDVTKRPHQWLPYDIYNYSPEVQFSKKWNDVTLNCRGLILDNNYNIVARPWKKFFNLGEVELGFQFTDPVEVMDKADGSLGILYPAFIDTPEVFDITWSIATRGSFHSEQAERATKIYRRKYGEIDPLPGYTMLFEIIYPSNRIVLDYGDMEDLVLLGAVENRTGYYHGPNQARHYWTQRATKFRNEGGPAYWPGPVVETYSYADVSTALANMGRKNREGYVIRRNNFLVKVKEPDYLDLHRLVTNCSPKTIWEQLKAGKSPTEITAAFPDEFHGMVDGFIKPLLDAYEKRTQEIFKCYNAAVQEVYNSKANAVDPYVSRAEYARVFKKYKDAGYFFKMLDNRPIRDMLWSELKPTAS